MEHAGFKLVGGTPSGLPNGAKYFNDKIGYTVFFYTNGTALAQGPHEHTTFDEPSKLIAWLTTYGNKFLDTEKVSIKGIVASYGLTAVEANLGGEKKVVEFLRIKDKAGDVLFNMRRLKGVYHLNKAGPAYAEQIVVTGDWNIFVEKLQNALKTWVEEHPQPESAPSNPSELSPTEVTAVEELVKKYGLKPKFVKQMGMVPYVGIFTSWESFVYAFRKLEGMYYVFNTIDHNNWKIIEEYPYFQQALKKLEELLVKLTTEKPPAAEPPATPAATTTTTTEHNGITPEEYQQIRDAVDSYGETSTTEYLKGVPGVQTPYVIVLQKEYDGKHNLYLSIGALGNYYRINSANNTPIFNSETLTGILQWLDEKLTSIVGGKKSMPAEDLSEIIHLMNEHHFGYASPGGGANGTNVYVKNKDHVYINDNDYVTFIRANVFGPIRHKPAKKFIEWFKNVYAKGELPPDSNGMPTVINGLVKGEGDLLIPKYKLSAIKRLRKYIIALTGGECSLAKAKWAVENLDKFLAYTAQHGLPSMDTHGPDLSGLFGTMSVQAPEQPATDELKLTLPERQELAEIIGTYSPTMKYQIPGDNSIILWVGANLASYKFEKVNGIYYAHSDMGAIYNEIYKNSSFNEFKKYIDHLCVNLMHILSKSKLDVVAGMDSAPSESENHLSSSQVKELEEAGRGIQSYSWNICEKEKVTGSQAGESL